MNTVLRPVGPEPPRVYWTRRLLILAALIVAATLVWTLVQGGGAPSDATAGTSPSAEDAPDGDADDDAAVDDESDDAAGASTPCAAENLELAIETGRNSYPDGARPSFTVTVTNTGEAGCTVDVGDA